MEQRTTPYQSFNCGPLPNAASILNPIHNDIPPEASISVGTHTILPPPTNLPQQTGNCHLSLIFDFLLLIFLIFVFLKKLKNH
mgnify:FL=1